MKRLMEIRARKAEIRGLLNGTETLAPERMDELEAELRTLDAEQAGIERRQSIAAGITDGTVIPEGPAEVNPITAPEQRSFDRETVLATPEYRSGWAKTLMGRKLNELEQRAVGTALTTTATTYVAATSEVNGVNNGGLFIPTSINTALMAAIGQVSPIFRDMAKTAVPGVLSFPYRAAGTGAGAQTEGTDTADGQVQWATLTLGSCEIAETIPVSWKLEAMAVEDFISYIEQELTDAVQDKAVHEGIYGAGGAAALTGITVGAVDTIYTGTALDGIATALATLTAKLKIGAKIYVSPSIVEEISFAKDANGGYTYSPLNSVGLNSIATYPVEKDPYLAAGDFIIGNVGRYYRLNAIEPFSVTKDVSGKKRVNEYTGYGILGGAPQPSCFAYGTAAT